MPVAGQCFCVNLASLKIMLHTYSAYGVEVESEILIPEFCPMAKLSAASKPVQVRWGHLVAPSLQSTPSACRCHIQPEEAYLEWPQGGLFLVRQGQEIIIDPADGADEKMIRTFLLGAAFGLLLYQRQHMVLHASAIAMEEGAVIFMGDRGAGKSTTAALFQSHGYPLLTDDVTVLQQSTSTHENVHLQMSDAVMVVPSFPQIKLWPESITSLGQHPDQFPTLNAWVEKRLYNPSTDSKGFAQQPYPLIGIYVLAWGEENEIVPLRGQDALGELMHNWYCARFGEAMMQHVSATDHLKTFAALINRVPVYDLVRKDSLAELGAIVPMVENHVKTLK